MQEKLLKLPEVREYTRRSTGAIYSGINAGTFPKPVRIGIRAVAWLQSDLKAWLDDRIAERNMRGAV